MAGVEGGRPGSDSATGCGDPGHRSCQGVATMGSWCTARRPGEPGGPRELLEEPGDWTGTSGYEGPARLCHLAASKRGSDWPLVFCLIVPGIFSFAAQGAYRREQRSPRLEAEPGDSCSPRGSGDGILSCRSNAWSVFFFSRSKFGSLRDI